MIRADMSAAAVKIHPAIDLESYRGKFARARTAVQRARYHAWRHQVEKFKTATGARPTLVHVPEDVWRAGFHAEADPCSAVVDQLTAFDD